MIPFQVKYVIFRLNLCCYSVVSMHYATNTERRSLYRKIPVPSTHELQVQLGNVPLWLVLAGDSMIHDERSCCVCFSGHGIGFCKTLPFRPTAERTGSHSTSTSTVIHHPR